MLTKEDVSRLRKNTTDNVIFDTLLKDDPKFKEGVERVQTMNPNMSGFEKVKFPGSMIDLYYGIDSGKPDDQTGAMAINATDDQPENNESPFSQGPLSYALETLGNVPESAMNYGKGMLDAVAHPIRTGTTILKAGIGGAVNSMEKIADLAGVKNAEDLFNFESEEVASAIGDFYAERYGSVEAAAKTLRDDPVGFLSDIATVVTGIGGVLKGGATAAGSLSGAATRTSTALNRTGKVLRSAQKMGDDIIQMGINMEPVVIGGKGVFMAGRGAARVLSPGGNAEALVHKGINLHPSQIRNFMKPNVSNGESPGNFILRKGISGTRDGIMDDLEKIAEKSKAAVDGELAKVRETFDIVDDVPQVSQALTEVQKFFEDIPGLEADLIEIKNLLAKDRLSLTEINGVKRMMDKNLRLFSKSNDPLMGARAQGLRNIRDGIKTFIEETAEKKGLRDIRVLNKDTQLSHELLDAMGNAATSRFSNNVLSLGDFMTGGVGGAFVGYDPLLTAGIVISRRILGSTLFKTTLAKYLNRLSPDELNKLLKVMNGSKHTKETIRLTRKVLSQTAEDVENKRIGHIEEVMASIDLMNQINQQSSATEGEEGQEMIPQEEEVSDLSLQTTESMPQIQEQPPEQAKIDDPTASQDDATTLLEGSQSPALSA